MLIFCAAISKVAIQQRERHHPLVPDQPGAVPPYFGRPAVRKALLALSFTLVAAPALAQSDVQRDAEKMADVLNNPATQEMAAGAIGAMMDSVLDMRIDGIAKALEPLNRGNPVRLPGRTMRDLATRDDPDFEDRMADRTRQAVGSMGAIASALSVAMPELERAMKRMKDSMPRGF